MAAQRPGDYFRYVFRLVLLMTQFIKRRFKRSASPGLPRIDIAPSKDRGTARQRFMTLKRNFIILSYRINRDQAPFFFTCPSQVYLWTVDADANHKLL